MPSGRCTKSEIKKASGKLTWSRVAQSACRAGARHGRHRGVVSQPAAPNGRCVYFALWLIGGHDAYANRHRSRRLRRLQRGDPPDQRPCRESNWVTKDCPTSACRCNRLILMLIPLFTGFGTILVGLCLFRFVAGDRHRRQCRGIGAGCAGVARPPRSGIRRLQCCRRSRQYSRVRRSAA